jgi:putative Mg2+ transporter-C (MgtC) family protein
MVLSGAYYDIFIALGSALAAGSIIGLERTYRGRPAGFRTHALVCLASALLMVIRIDPTRMAQGIMTGIGFLGAGVIFKEGLTVRGLTTAASIWITAALGILYGVGFYLPAVFGTVATIGVLALFRVFERLMPSQYFFRFRIRYAKENVPELSDLLGILKENGFTASALSYTLAPGGETFEYETVIRSSHGKAGQKLTVDLLKRPDVVEFSILPSGD